VIAGLRVAHGLLLHARVSPAVSTQRFARWTRHAVIAAIPLMGIVLFAVAWSTYRGASRASDTLIRGEAETMHAAVRAELFDEDGRSIDERLAAALEARADDGLRYVGLIDPSGTVLGTAGASSADVPTLLAWAAASSPQHPVRVGDRVRVIFKWRPRGRRGGSERRPPPPVMLLEFEPRVADQLRDNARDLLVLGALAAVALTVMASVLVRWSLRREAAVRAAEQARRLATLGQMSAVLAHEIRNPLASLKGNAQLLAAQLPEGERPRAKADRVVEEATRLELLSNDLLEFARGGELRVAEADPAALVREAAGAAAPGRVEIDDAAAPRAWPLDREKMRQVLVNLVENAAELGAGAIEARVARAERRLVIEIRDHGPGIAEADLPHVFEPFFTRRTRGTGLGLAVARRLVDLHGGTLTAANAPGGGAIFRMEVPWRAS
jgi:two-component system sensor histidine kinase HydH